MFELIDFLIVNPIANILFAIYNLVGDFGIAIILFTIIVKLLMWPLMKKQLHQTKLMRKLQPELVEIKKRCNGNRQMESIQTMDLYKKYNVKPFRSFLTLLIQLPIFIAIFTAINVMVRPQLNSNLETRAYSFVQNGRISNLIQLQKHCLHNDDGSDKNAICVAGATEEYDFHPQLFGVVNLDAKLTDAFNGSIHGTVILIFAIGAVVMQYLAMKQQMPSKNKKKKTFRQIMQEAQAGKEPDQADLNNMMTGQMSKIMPLMMFMIMIALPGAIVMYYMLINILNYFQQRMIFHKNEDDMEILADKKIVKEYNKIQRFNKIKEAEIIKNKKTGTTITRIKAKDINSKTGKNKKRRK